MSRRYLLGLAVLVLATAFLPGSRADDKQPPAKVANAAAVALIDKLAEVAEVDIGYNPYVSGSAFAPLADRDRVSVMVLGLRPNQTSDAFRELVKLGPAAVPELVAHLNDTRPTKIKIGGGPFLSINKEQKSDKRNGYTLKVGDLCYVALGQIVNRNYAAATFIPSTIVSVFTPTRDSKVRADLKKEWGEITPERHRQSLLKDWENKDDERIRSGAILRLSYYYPEALEGPALQFLARPLYSPREAEAFVRKKLYTETDDKKRRELFDAYVKQNGVGGSDGIRRVLFSDLSKWISYEMYGLSSKPEFGEKPRQLLMEYYGAPKTVRFRDQPTYESINSSDVREFIESGLTYDRSVKIDHAVRDHLTKTTDDHLALACIERLVGRGYDAEIEAYYLRREKDLSKYQKDTFKEFIQKAVWTPLHVAAWRRQQDRLTELLREGAKVNASAKNGCTPLHVAAAEANTEAIKALLDAGADLMAKDSEGQTPVSVASFKGHTETVQQLIAAGSPISDILVAATVGKTEEATEFLRKDKEARRAKDSAGCTPLHRATAEGHLKVMQILLDAGADVDSQNNDKCTPLGIAAACGWADAYALLIERKAKVEGLSETQPIHLAAEYGRLEVIKLLVEKGAKVDARNKFKDTPLLRASIKGHLAVVKWFIEHGADINARDADGKTALNYTRINQGNKEMEKLLMKYGAKDN